MAVVAGEGTDSMLSSSAEAVFTASPVTPLPPRTLSLSDVPRRLFVSVRLPLCLLGSGHQDIFTREETKTLVRLPAFVPLMKPTEPRKSEQMDGSRPAVRRFLCLSAGVCLFWVCCVVVALSVAEPHCVFFPFCSWSLIVAPSRVWLLDVLS